MSDELKVIEGGVTNAVLKSLSVTGFKSFVHTTHLEFAPGDHRDHRAKRFGQK